MKRLLLFLKMAVWQEKARCPYLKINKIIKLRSKFWPDHKQSKSILGKNSTNYLIFAIQCVHDVEDIRKGQIFFIVLH